MEQKDTEPYMISLFDWEFIFIKDRQYCCGRAVLPDGTEQLDYWTGKILTIIDRHAYTEHGVVFELNNKKED